MLLITFSAIFLLCGCSFLNGFRSIRFHSNIKLPTKPTQSGDMVSKKIAFDHSKSLTRLFSNLPASVNDEDDSNSIRSFYSKIKKIEDEIANLNIELSDTTNEQERILIRQEMLLIEQQRTLIREQIVEQGKQLSELIARLSTGEFIQTSQ